VSDAFFLPLDAPADLDLPAARDGSAGPRPTRFAGQEACTGPWSTQAMHGGPPAALLVLACEEAVRTASPDGHTAALLGVRASVDFLSPVPVGEVSVAARLVRPGRRIALGEAVMTAAGREVLHARVWFASQSSADARTPDVVHGTVRTEASTQPVGPTAPEHRRAGPEDYPESLREWRFPYAEAMQWRSVSGDALGPGDAAVWSTPRIPSCPAGDRAGCSGLCSWPTRGTASPPHSTGSGGPSSTSTSTCTCRARCAASGCSWTPRRGTSPVDDR